MAFLVVDVALVAMALRSGRDAPATSQVAASLTTLTTPTTLTTSPDTSAPSPSVTTSTATTTTPSSTAVVTQGGGTPGGVPVARLVSALDASTAWRASAGSCVAGGSRVEVTTDGGATWTRLPSPARAVARVQLLSERGAFVIGAGAECEPRQYATRDAGQSWQPPTPVSGGWARRLDEPTRVLSPKDPKAAPCGTATVVDLSRTSATQAEALCGGGSVVVTNDGGHTWTDAGSAPGAVALGTRLVGGGTLGTYAVRVVAACQGLQVARVTADQGLDPVACVGADAVAPGQVGLSVTPTAAWIVAGEQTWVASGDLTAWRLA
ncbi:hypothetical protein [Terrabacter terrigena]|uniref:hypothetical protein n=1 Tax=Terrabacter terrigena TaxID=574718 RepID=UPI0036DE035C